MDNVYLLSHSVHCCILPFPPPVCLYCGCAELRFPVWYSSLSVDIHINYPDCQEPISVSFAPSAFLLPVCVYMCLCIPGCLFGRTFLYTRLSWIETGDVCCCVSNGVALSGFACACFGSRRR